MLCSACVEIPSGQTFEATPLVRLAGAESNLRNLVSNLVLLAFVEHGALSASPTLILVQVLHKTMLMCKCFASVKKAHEIIKPTEQGRDSFPESVAPTT